MKKLPTLLKSFRLVLLGIVALVISFGQLNSVVFADDNSCPAGMSQIDCQAVANNWADWVPDVCGGQSSSTTLTGSDSQAKAFNYFVGKGLSAVQAAGVEGNIQQESGFDPTRVQDGYGPHDSDDPSGAGAGGWGIVQWTPGEKVIEIQQQAGVSGNIDDLATQLDIVWWEMNNVSPTGVQDMVAGLKQITGGDAAAADDAAAYFNKNFESGGTGNRAAYAEAILQQYGSLAASSSSNSGSTSATTTTPSCNSANGASTGSAGLLGDPGTAVIAAIDSYGGEAQCVGYVEYELKVHFPPYAAASGGGYSPIGNGDVVTQTLASEFGVTRNSTPAVHSVFSMNDNIGPAGHTGIVSAVNSDGSFVVEDYNYSAPGVYGTRTFPASYIQTYGMTFAHTEVNWH